MRGLAPVFVAMLGMGCRYDLDHRPQPDASATGRACRDSTAGSCVDAVGHADFQWLEDNLFLRNCFGSSCHEGPNPSGKLDFRKGITYAALMGDGSGVFSELEPTRKLVVPGDPGKSYLWLMVRGVEPQLADPPADPPDPTIGFMPMSNAILCCQKLDAIERWILAGALND
jgi:hypothetical protein